MEESAIGTMIASFIFSFIQFINGIFLQVFCEWTLSTQFLSTNFHLFALNMLHFSNFSWLDYFLHIFNFKIWTIIVSN